MYKACWVQHGGEQEWALLIADALKKMGIEIFFVSILREFHEEIKLKGYKSLFISDVFTHPKNSVASSPEDLNKKYGYPFLGNIINSDYLFEMLSHYDYNQKANIIIRAYQFWEEVYQKEPFDLFIARETATFATRTAYNFSKNQKIPMFCLEIGPFDEFFTLCDVGEDLCAYELVENLKKGLTPLSQDKVAYVQECVSNRLKDIENKIEIWSPLTVKGFIRLYFKYLFWNLKTDDKYDPYYKLSAKQAKLKLVNKFIWQNFSSRVFPYYKPSFNEKYVYFPLYYEDETMTRANHHFWSRNMVGLIEEVSASLPDGYSLFIKEHPAIPGEHSWSRLNKFKRIPKVKVIDPYVPSLKLIKFSKIIFLLSGSAGWEGLLFKKPVIALGSHIYTLSRHVCKLKDIQDLGSMFDRILKNHDRLIDENMDEWYWYIYMMISSSYEGSFYCYLPPYFRMMNKENCEKIACGIFNKFKKLVNFSEEEKLEYNKRVKVKEHIENMNIYFS